MVIVNFNGGDDLCHCIESVLSQETEATVRVVVVDNGSADGSERAAADAFGTSIEVLEPGRNLGYGEAVNLAVGQHPGDFIVVLNPDIVLEGGCIAAMLEAEQRSPGIVGPELLVGSTGVSESGLTINHTGMPTVQKKSHPPLYLSGCALGIRRSAFDALGGFDGRYFLFVEDVELCWRALNAGFDVGIAPRARAMHRGGGSMEGGYPLAGQPYLTSDLRISLRERNTLPLMLGCAPAWWLPVVIPAVVARTLALTLGAIALRRRSLASRLLAGLAWNWRELGASLDRRRSGTLTAAGRREASRRFTHEPLLYRTLRSHGLPVFSEAPP